MDRLIGRRQFVRSSMAGSAAVLVSGRTRAHSISPSDQIGIGIIGFGRQGGYNMSKFMEFPECKVLAVCDVYAPHLEKARARTGADAYTDFRKVLERADIDAVVISTPDHWHPLQAVMACQAGKDVYVEKPVSVTVREGRWMVEAARKYKRVIQVGAQQRSGIHFAKAVDVVRGGAIGTVTEVRTWNFGNAGPEGIGNPPDCEPPAGLDWDFWLGPAPKVPFNPNRFGVAPDRWSTFRMFWDYAGGMMTDWGVHLLDIVLWAMNVRGPAAVSAAGGKFALRDNRETPDTLTALYEFPGFICTYENRECNSQGIGKNGYGIEFYGTEGTLFVDRSGFELQPQQRRTGDKAVPRTYAMQMENVNDNNHDHVADFLECMKTRKAPVSDIEIGHLSTATCLLANVSYRTGRKIRWNATNEQIIGDEEASAYLTREFRSPWKMEI